MTDARAQKIEKQVSAEIARQLAQKVRYRDDLTRQLAALFAAQSFGISETKLSDRENRARARAREILSEHGRDFPQPNTETSEEKLFIERDACDFAIAALKSDRIQALAGEAVIWATDHAAEWREICRDWTLSAARFVAAERRASEFRLQEISHYVPSDAFEIMEFVGTGASIELPGSDLESATKAAIKGKVVTSAELKGIENAK